MFILTMILIISNSITVHTVSYPTYDKCVESKENSESARLKIEKDNPLAKVYLDCSKPKEGN